MIGIIGGSGIYSLGEMKKGIVETPYGKVELYAGEIGGEEVVFIPRHGEEHGTPPHMIDYKANIWAMKEKKVDGIIAFYAAGIIDGYVPGDLILLEDFIGFFTPITYFDNFEGEIKHMDMSEPYSWELAEDVAKAAKLAGVELKEGGIIATTTGPRFETKAEVKVLRSMGANLVNMTSAYEAALAGELGLSICGVAVGTNYATGIKGEELTGEEVIGVMEKSNEKIKKIVKELGK